MYIHLYRYIYELGCTAAEEWRMQWARTPQNQRNRYVTALIWCTYRPSPCFGGLGFRGWCRCPQEPITLLCCLGFTQHVVGVQATYPRAYFQ